MAVKVSPEVSMGDLSVENRRTTRGPRDATYGCLWLGIESGVVKSLRQVWGEIRF